MLTQPRGSSDPITCYAIAYDIPDDRRRTRVHALLSGFGTWRQFSLFECFLTRRQRVMLESRLLEELDQQEDTLRIYSLCGACLPKVEVLGYGEPPHDILVYYFY